MANDPTFSRVELSVKCTGLANMDRLSKSDPMCVLFSRKQGQWSESGRTEVIRDNLNPTFAKTFVLPYHFEEDQPLKLSVYDVDNASKDLKQHDFIGETEFSLANVLVAGEELVMNLTRPGDRQRRGKVHVTGEEVEESKGDIEFLIRGNNLDKKDFFGKSDPYLEISRGQENGSFVLVHRTEIIKKTLNPKWNSFRISAQKLCNGDYNRPLRFTVWDWDRNDEPDLIGYTTSSLQALLGDEKAGLNPIAALELIEPNIKAKKGQKYKNSGVLQFLKCKTFVIPTFIDYIRGGCSMSLMVAVDFTASNGDPNIPTSLHYYHPYQANEYVQAIQSVGNILAPYDSDQWFPAWGFGAKLPTNRTSHCFALNGNDSNPEVYGVQGILDAYLNTLRQVRLHGPTIFSQILSSAIHQVSPSKDLSEFRSQKKQQYSILLIITDGVINDMQDTIDRIVEASDLPLSIVIVGVGGADFKMMNQLDADTEPLRSRRGKVMSRDIVQFVPLRQFTSQAASFSLAREVLAEIPDQLTGFMASNNIQPSPPRKLEPQQSVSVIPTHQAFQQSFHGQQPFQQSFHGQQPFQQSFHGQQPFQQSFHGQQPFQQSFHGQQPFQQSFHGQQPFQQRFHGQPPLQQSFHGQQPYPESTMHPLAPDQAPHPTPSAPSDPSVAPYPTGQ